MMNLHDPIAALLGSWAAEINVWSALLRIALAILCSAIIGCERATKRHAAGLRTFMLACLASAIAMMVDQSLGGGIPIVSAAAEGRTLRCAGERLCGFLERTFGTHSSIYCTDPRSTA